MKHNLQQRQLTFQTFTNANFKNHTKKGQMTSSNAHNDMEAAINFMSSNAQHMSSIAKKQRNQSNNFSSSANQTRLNIKSPPSKVESKRYVISGIVRRQG
jgi:hypothetical protein